MSAGELSSNRSSDSDWLEVLRENEAWLRKVLRNRLRNQEEVNDVFQEIGVAVSRRDVRPDEPHNAKSWLYRVAIRQVLQYRRKSGRYRNLLNRNQDLTPPSHFQVESDPLAMLMNAERDKAIHEALQSLSDLDREILMLKYVENWTYNQLAENLGVSKNTIEHRLVRSKKKLRQILAQQADGVVL